MGASIMLVCCFLWLSYLAFRKIKLDTFEFLAGIFSWFIVSVVIGVYCYWKLSGDVIIPRKDYEAKFIHDTLYIYSDTIYKK
jgi:hypothetical protein